MQFDRRSRTGCMLALLIGSLASPAVALNVHSLDLSQQTVGQSEPLFINFGLDETFENPFDPRQIDVVCEFTGPSGQTRWIPAFYAADNPGWEARIAPLERGMHTGRIVAEDAYGNTAVASFTFESIVSDNPGFIRIDDRNPEYMRFDNGDPYFPVGMNACWGGSSLYYPKMGAVGVNWTRYWVVPFTGGGIEWNGGGGTLGRYDQTLAINEIDNLCNLGRLYGIYVQLCLDSFTGWNVEAHDNWHVSPYNNDNGGMLENPVDYFYNAEARRLARQRYRYIVARWAYSTNILCWEFWNEVDAVGWGQDWSLSFWSHVPQVRQWHADMGDYIRSIDPFHHLRTTSFANTASWIDDYNSLWQLSQMDLAQVHRYSPVYPGEQIAAIRQYDDNNKPVILGETGIAATPPGGGHDNLLHDLIWPAAVCQSGAMSWWWDNWIDPRNLYYHFEPLNAFLEGEDFAPEFLHPATAFRVGGPMDMQVYGSSGPHSAYLWLLWWYGTVSDARLRIDGIEPGNYTVEYWNTYAGTKADEQVLTVAAGQSAFLDVPPFNRDVAIKVKSQHPLIEVSPSQIAAHVYTGAQLASDQIVIGNPGFDVATYTITDDADWLSVDPDSGSVTDEQDTIEVIYDMSDALPGTYAAQMTITSAEALNSPITVSVTVEVESHPADADRDGDVDQSDFGLLQACRSEVSGPGLKPDCESFDLNGDGFVDQSDLTLWERCVSGAGIPTDTTCLE